MQIAIDIHTKLEQDFGNDFFYVRDEIEALYAATNWAISNQLIRCIVYLSKGDKALLQKNIERVQVDYRDVLWEAEYDRGEEQLRDFNRTFQALGLL